MYIEGEM